MTGTNDRQMQQITRRGFLSGTGAAALSFAVVKAGAVAGTQANSRIKAGVIGLGGRGRMIAGMVQKHGGYEIIALADYFDQVANAAGEQLGVAQGESLLGPIGLQGGHRRGRRGRLHGDAALLLPGARRGGGRSGPARLHRQAAGLRRPRLPANPVRREEGDREQESVPVRLPDPHGPVLHRGRQAGARRARSARSACSAPSTTTRASATRRRPRPSRAACRS